MSIYGKRGRMFQAKALRKRETQTFIFVYRQYTNPFYISICISFAEPSVLFPASLHGRKRTSPRAFACLQPRHCFRTSSQETIQTSLQRGNNTDVSAKRKQYRRLCKGETIQTSLQRGKVSPSWSLVSMAQGNLKRLIKAF